MVANIKLCMFDFDDTLVYTRFPELSRIRPMLARNCDTSALENFVNKQQTFIQVDQQFLQYLRLNFANMKLGVFTKAPTAYVRYMLNYCFPGFEWDVVVAYEHVGTFYKPNPYGIKLAMRRFGITSSSEVIYVGDDDRDLQTARNCGCYFVQFNLMTIDRCCQELLRNLA